MAVAAAGVRAERTRILSTLLDRIEQIIDRALEAMRAEIPAYAAQDERFFSDVREQVRRALPDQAALPDGGPEDVRLEDLSFARGAAIGRARAGFALEDYINAFRVGQQVFWEVLVEVAGENPRAATRRRSGSRCRSCATSTSPRRTPATRTSSSSSISWPTPTASAATCSSTCWPATCPRTGRWPRPPARTASARARRCWWPPRSPSPRPCDGDAPHAASAAIARSLLGDTRALVVVRQTEIVAVAALGPGSDPARVCERRNAVEARLREAGLPLAAGVSSRRRPGRAAARLPGGARRARTRGRPRGVAALPRLSARLPHAEAGDRPAPRRPASARVPGRGPRPRRPAARDRSARSRTRTCACASPPSACRSTRTPRAIACAACRSAAAAIPARSRT